MTVRFRGSTRLPYVSGFFYPKLKKMINFMAGDLLLDKSYALINTVNCVGIMGKGIALQFKTAYPHNYKKYSTACKSKQLEPGKLLPVWDINQLSEKKLIINFPTKVHWRDPSKYQYIQSGLLSLAYLLEQESIPSVAMPALGCGYGGLDWSKVKELITDLLSSSTSEIFVYEPKH